MKNSLLVLFLILPLCCLGADVQTVRIEDFSLGLNTAQKATKLSVGEAVIASNLDLTKNPGGLTIRQGYDRAIRFSGADSILTNGLITYTLRNGDRRLVVLTDSSGAPYGTAYVSDPNTLDFNIDLTAAGGDGTDTLYVVPDTAYANRVVKVFPSADSVSWRLKVWSNDCSDNILGPAIFDTMTTRAAIVDSIMTFWPMACSTYITLFDAGDSIGITEVSAGNGVYQVNVGAIYPYAAGGWDQTVEPGVVATTATRRIPLSGQIQYTQHNGDLYIFNGVSSGLVFDDETSRRFPVKAPGEVDAMPVLVDSNGIPGIYRYAVKFTSGEKATGDTLVNNQFSVLTGEVEACDSCGILLSGWPVPNVDKRLTGDTVTAQLWRTTALTSYIDKRDTIWNTGISLSFDALSGYSSVEVLDTISDDSLRNSTGVVYADGNWYALFPDTVADSGATGADTNVYAIYPKPGAPSILSWSSSSDTGIWAGIDSSWTTAAGWSWFYVKYDTLIGIASDSSRSVSLYQEAAPISYASQWGFNTGLDSVRLAFSRDSLQKVKIVLPRCEDSNMVYLLYRMPIKPIVYDTTIQKTLTSVVPTDSVYTPFQIPLLRLLKKKWNKDLFRFFGGEFIALDARLIGQYNPGDTAVDSLGYLAFLSHTPYRRNRVPGRVKEAISADGILYLADDQNVFTSTSYDTTLNFSALNQRPIGPEDGGIINALWQDRSLVKVGKTNRLYNLYQIESDLFGSAEVSNNFGVIAPHSNIEAPEGEYILSGDGYVRLLSDGTYRERVNNIQNMSNQLDNFKKLPVAKLSRVFGFYFDNKLFYSVGDTTYVLNKAAGRQGYSFGWTTWNLSISAATRYRVATDGNVPDTLYFAKPGENAIYRLGGSTRDCDADSVFTTIDWRWRSGALTDVSFDRWQPFDMVMNCYSTDSTSANIVIDMYDGADNLQGNAEWMLGRIDTANVYRNELGTVGSSPYWYIDLYTINPIGKAPPPNTETTIEGILLKLLKRGEI